MELTPLQKPLDRWAAAVDRELPHKCPKCGHDLPKVLYAHDYDAVRYRLTGAELGSDYYKAICPTCDHVLLKEHIATAQKRCEARDEQG